MSNSPKITHLDYPFNVREAPGMYVPSMTHLVFEIVDNSVDEYLAGYGKKITVIIYLYNRQIIVIDEARGMPIDPMDDPKFAGKSQAEVAYTELHAGGKFKNQEGSYVAKTGGLHGVGSAVVNALSSALDMYIKKDNKNYLIQFETGKTTKQLHEIDTDIFDSPSGTGIVFTPDEKMWGEEELDIDSIKKRLRQTAFLNPGLELDLTIVKDEEETDVEKLNYCYEDGISEFITSIARESETELILEPIRLTSTINDIDIDISLAYTSSYKEEMRSFCNSIATTDGGSHEQGFKEALYKTITKVFESSNQKIKLKPEDTREGLISIITCRIKNPVFDGQSKSKLKMLSAQRAVNQVVSEELEDYLDKNPSMVKLLADKVKLAAAAREAATRARDTTRKTKELNNLSTCGKLADCTSNIPEECEVYIVEGDSAGGSAKQGRNRYFQAILPIDGKISNTYDSTLAKALSNPKIKLFVAALGTSIGKDFNYSKLRYHKIVLMSDADEDGGHIAVLNITFIYMHMRPLIEQGHVYLANPPLFIITLRNGTKIYAWTEEEKQQIISQHSNVEDIQRFKGLTLAPLSSNA